jgi:hypothetical protein
MQQPHGCWQYFTVQFAFLAQPTHPSQTRAVGLPEIFSNRKNQKFVGFDVTQRAQIFVEHGDLRVIITLPEFDN